MGLHPVVSLAAIFKIELAKEQLESSESPQTKVISEVSEILFDAIEKIAHILEERKQDPGVNHDSS
jgi:hypothetical protein